jgi:hypothetical protein
MSEQPTTEAVDLKPCPFCGSTDIDATGWASLLKVGPVCNSCGACADSPERWNRRAPEPRAKCGCTEPEHYCPACTATTKEAKHE